MIDLNKSVSISGRSYRLFRDKNNFLWLCHVFIPENDPIPLFGPIDASKSYGDIGRNKTNDPYIDAAQRAYRGLN